MHDVDESPLRALINLGEVYDYLDFYDVNIDVIVGDRGDRQCLDSWEPLEPLINKQEGK